MESHSDAFPGGQAKARSTDPQTSWEAAASVGNLREEQAKVWFVLRRWGPLIHERLIERCRALGFTMSESGIRTRCSELVNAGLVEDSGEKGQTHRGRRSTKWRAISLREWRERQDEEATQTPLF